MPADPRWPKATWPQILEIRSRAEVGNYLPKNGVGIELGVDEGENAEALLKAARPRDLYLVDDWGWRPESYDVCCNRFKDNPTVTIRRCPIETFLSSLVGCKFDWAYIDSEHSYEATLRHILMVMPFMGPSSCIAGHDFKVEPRDWRTGVPRAVIEVAQYTNWKLVALSNEDNADWILRSPDSTAPTFLNSPDYKRSVYTLPFLR